MRSYGGLWRQIVDAENLRAAWRRVRRHHANSDEYRAFEANLDANLFLLKDELECGRYQPGAYRQFKIWDPKPRIISCAPVRDRVVHHALCDIISPLLERSFIETSFACCVGKGSHAACAKAQELARRYAYCLKLDVHHYFDSIDHEILLPVIGRYFREKPVKDLIEKIVKTYERDSGKGLPIGNLTSQWLANTFLNEFDHLAVVGFKPCRSVENVAGEREHETSGSGAEPQIYTSTRQKRKRWLHSLHGRHAVLLRLDVQFRAASARYIRDEQRRGDAGR